MRNASYKTIGIAFASVVTLFVAVTASLAQESAPTILVRGSSSAARLIDPLAKKFETSTKAGTVIIFGSTHGDGVSALIEGKAQVAMLARPLNPEEIRQFRQANRTVHQEFLCHDAVAIVVHPSNPVKELSLEQLGKILSGVFTNWNQVGGPDQGIEVVDRPKESGMRSFLANDILSCQFLSKPAVATPHSRVPDEVGRRVGGIGYCRDQLVLTSDKSAWTTPLAIKPHGSSEAIPLTVENIREKTYPIMRSLWLCYVEQTASESVKRFVEFCGSKIPKPVTAQNTNK